MSDVDKVTTISDSSINNRDLMQGSTYYDSFAVLNSVAGATK